MFCIIFISALLCYFVLLLDDWNNQDCDITLDFKESKYVGTVETSDWIDIMRGTVVRETRIKEWFKWNSQNSQKCVFDWSGTLGSV